jgi:RNA polymerase-binding transcription factor DksA
MGRRAPACHARFMNTLSDEELRVTRSHLIARGDELRERVRRARLDLARAAEPLPRDSAEAAISVENDEILEAIEQSALSELECIDVALERIEAGTFAKCDECGQAIPAERLRLVPHATRCWDCSG